MTISQLITKLPKVKFYHKYIFKTNLKLIHDQFEWGKFIVDGLFNNTGVTINEDEPILIYDIDYLNKTTSLWVEASNNNNELKNQNS